MLVKMNKKGIGIPIGILMLLVIVLLVYTGYFVLAREKNIRSEINVCLMDEVYFSELEVNFILENIFENVVREMEFEDGRDVFISGFSEELDSYRKSGVYMVQGLESVEEQLDNVVFDEMDRNVVLVLNIEIMEFDDEGVVRYDYEKRFERGF